MAVAFSRGNTLASGSKGNSTVVGCHYGECRKTLNGHTTQVWSVAFSPQGNTLASGSDNGIVKLWDVSTGECRKTLKGHTHQVWQVAFSPQGKTLVSGSKREQYAAGMSVQVNTSKLRRFTDEIWSFA